MTENSEQEMYRVQTLCGSCGATYLSTAMDKKEAPVRCKECKSSKTRVNSEKETSVWTVYLE